MEEIIRIVSIYKNIELQQLFILFSGKKDILDKIIKHLAKQRKIFYIPNSKIVSATEENQKDIDNELIKSFWVLLEFKEKINFHSISDFPVKIIFFINSSINCYQILYIKQGKEHFFNMYFKNQNTENCQQIIIIENPEQIELIKIENTFCFCTVDSDNNVQFFKNRKG